MNDLLHLTEGVRRGGLPLHLTKLSARKAHTLCRWIGVIVLA